MDVPIKPFTKNGIVKGTSIKFAMDVGVLSEETRYKMYEVTPIPIEPKRQSLLVKTFITIHPAVKLENNIAVPHTKVVPSAVKSLNWSIS